MNIESMLRTFEDFPEPGVNFFDISPMLQDPNLLREVCTALAEPFTEDGVVVDKVVALDARGFLFAPMVSELTGAGIVPARKAGKLPGETIQSSYDLEYGSAAIEIQADAIQEGDRVLLLDDVIATGGTLKAAASLVEHQGAEVVGIAALIGLDDLSGMKDLQEGYPQARMQILWSV